jgi:hypothetical protein
MENFTGQIVNVLVSKDGKTGSKPIKVCKVKVHSVLFIEVDKPNRKNIFWKLDKKNIESFGDSDTGPFIKVKDGILLSDNKWESEWDSIGQPTPMSLNNRIKPQYSNHSKGWAPQYTARLKANSQYNYGGGAHFRT